jgi:uncharacterized repeat protein (TIGR01451 family)
MKSQITRGQAVRPPRGKQMRRIELALWAACGVLLLIPGTTRATTSAYPTPLAGELPSGSLIYDPSVSGTISGGNPSDSYTLALDSGQTLTVLVTPAAGLQPSVAVYDPANSLLGTATAGAAGSAALLQCVPVASAGTYTFVVSGASGTGSYTARATLNAALENEAYGGAANDTIATAQDLSSTAVALATGADRMAVLGGIAGAADTDVYSFSLSAGQVATLLVTSQGAGVSHVVLEDGGGNPLAAGSAGPTNVGEIISHFVAPVSGTYYALVTGDASEVYSLVVTRGAEFDSEPNDTLGTAQPLVAGAALGYLPGNADDYFSVRASEGDNLHMQTTTPAGGPGEFVNGLYPELLLYDPNGNLVAIANGNAIDGRNSVIDFTVPNGDAGIWTVQVTYSPSTQNPTQGEFVLVFTGATGAPPVPDLTVSKSHIGTFVRGTTATWSITVHNAVPGSSTSGTVTVSDVLPSAYTLSSYSGIGWSCSGTTSVTCTSTLVVAGGLDFPVLSLTVNVPAGSPANVANTAIVSGGGEREAANDTATDPVDVVDPPSIAAAFNPPTVQSGATTSLGFTITNPAANAVALTGVAFSDALPAGLVVTSGSSGVCGGTLTTTAPGGIALTGASIAVSSTCQLAVAVTALAPGGYTTTTGAVTAANGGMGNSATASLTVVEPVPLLGASGLLALVLLLGAGAVLLLLRRSSV